MVQLTPRNVAEHRVDLEDILSYVVAPEARARAIYFYGEVGIGKTALLRYLERQLPNIAPTALTALVSFNAYDCLNERLTDFLYEIVVILGPANFPRSLAHIESVKSGLTARSQLGSEIGALELFQGECRILARTRPIILFFDNFEQVADNSFGEWFINCFLPNLIGQVVIFAGLFPLTQVPDTIEVNHLQGLGREDSKELLTRITGHTPDDTVLDKLLALSRGNPRLLRMAADFLRPDEDIDWEQIAHIFKEEIKPLDVQEVELRPRTVIPYWAKLIDQSRIEESRSEQEIGVEFTPPNLLHLQMSLPPLLAIDDYINIVADRLWTIELLYIAFVLVNSGDSYAVSRFVTLLGKYPTQTRASRSRIRTSLESTTIEPLRLVSAHYGSPASFDLLGIGKILEILRDTVKDLIWRGKHERQMAELERQNKEAANEKLRLESDKIITDILAQRIEMIERASNLELASDDKRLIVQALLPPMRMIANPAALLLESSKPRRKKGRRVTRSAA